MVCSKDFSPSLSLSMGGAGLRDCLFSAIMVGKTRRYWLANYTIINRIFIE